MLRRLLFDSYVAQRIEGTLKLRLIGAGWMPPATSAFLTATVHNLAEEVKELLEKAKPEPTALECEKCGAVGGRTVSATNGARSLALWACPFCIDSDRANAARAVRSG